MLEWQMKKMLISVFDIKDIVHFEFIPQGHKVNQVYYVEILKQLLKAMHRKGPELWPNSWILHHERDTLCQAFSGPEIDY
jgi:hypothetical protein